MKIDWKGLKYQKELEIPAAEIARQKRENEFNKRVDRITDTVEKNLYKACKNQEAGVPVEYNILEMGSFWDSVQDSLFMMNNWTWEWDVKDEVLAGIIRRLENESVTVTKKEGQYCAYTIVITLP